MQTVNEKIIIHEVGLRDGLQTETKRVLLETKVEWAEQLLTAGVPVIQLGSFVHPDKVPQMATTDALFHEMRLRRQAEQHSIFSGLVLNEKGLERGMEYGVELFCMGVSASNTHSRKNTGMSTHDAMSRVISMAQNAIASGFRVQLSVQSAFGCGYEGPIEKYVIMDMIKQFLDAGFTHISLADTAGYAFPDQVFDYFTSIYELTDQVTASCHFHDTFGTGIANCLAAYQTGVRQFEASVGGLGGCPFTRIQAGNVCSEDLIYMFDRMGCEMLPDLDAVLNLSKTMSDFFERALPGRLAQAGIPDFFRKGQAHEFA